MTQAQDVQAAAFQDGTLTLLDRVVGDNGVAIVQADISAAEYTAYLLDDSEPATRTAITGHTAESLAVADIIHDTLQTDSRWTEDTTGYNLEVLPDVSSNPIFATAGRRVLIVVKLTPVSGQVILVRFKINVI